MAKMLVTRRRTAVFLSIVVIWWVSITGTALADDHFDGYSYAVIGMQALSYSEHSSLFKSQANARNLAFESGGLFSVNNQMDFSLDTASSLVNTLSNEQWNSTRPISWSNSSGNGSIGSGTLVQTDSFMMDVSSIRALLQYKYTPNLRMVGGLTYLALNAQRSLSTTNYPSLINASNSMVNERNDTFSASVGAAWESGGLADNIQRWRLRGVLDLPIFRQVTNSNFSTPIYSGFDWGFDISAAYDIRVYKGLEVGVLSDYFYRRGNSATLGNGNAQYPQHTCSQLFAGVEFGWNLSRQHRQ